MTAEILMMSIKEQERATMMQQLLDGYIKQQDAAKTLGLSTRQVRNLASSYRKHGAAGMIHGNRGKVSHRKVSDAEKQRFMDIVHQHYHDFSPTFAHEKLTEAHGFSYSVETLRQWMVADGLWVPKSKKHKRTYQMRQPRPRLGELIQIDGSPHDWFEGRAPKCTLIVFIDDATSKLMTLRFFPTETTEAYMTCLRDYLQRYGKPAALYSDRHSIFRVNKEDAMSGEQVTQFGRALKSLDIESIHANTPQAKGRVERANQTLQDRLIKEMRLAGISNMEDGNAFLDAYMEKHNDKFAKQPLSDVDAHRAVLQDDSELDLILCKHISRKLSKNLTLQYCNTLYQIKTTNIGYTMRGAAVNLCEDFDGNIKIFYKGRQLNYQTFKRGETPQPIVDEKNINNAVNKAITKQRKYKPSSNHIWRTPITSQAPI
ncbi:MAG: ISNCY family transposase [Ghiorsea sp.]|nr:ISNCY family transposase [Ghiorsea sp.]